MIVRSKWESARAPRMTCIGLARCERDRGIQGNSTVSRPSRPGCHPNSQARAWHPRGRCVGRSDEGEGRDGAVAVTKGQLDGASVEAPCTVAGTVVEQSEHGGRTVGARWSNSWAPGETQLSGFARGRSPTMIQPYLLCTWICFGHQPRRMPCGN